MSLTVVPKSVKRAFVAFLDNHYTHYLVNKLIAMDVEVTGIVREGANTSNLNPKIKKVLKRGDSESIRQGLLDADYIVYHTPECAEDTIKALRLLASSHYESEKRFVLLSSVMSWFETPAIADAAGDEEAEPEPLTEDQYNRRVPHIKYQVWRDVEKLCCSSGSDRLKTFVVFAGLMYGKGENILYPLFKQAWTLAAEGLPLYGKGTQIVPMIHVQDCATFTYKILTFEELPETRYYFAADDGNCSWRNIVTALNTTLGNGKTFPVPPREYGLHDNVEHFVVNLKLDAAQIQTAMADESDWVAKSGFVENIEQTCREFREARGVLPLRVLMLGPPSVGKSYSSRELASHYRLPHFNIADVITEYRFQEVELQEEILRVKSAKLQMKREEKTEEKRLAEIDNRKNASAEGDHEAHPSTAEVDEDDVEDDDDVEVTLSPEEEQEIAEAVEAEVDGDDNIITINEKLAEIKKVLAMKLKPVGVENIEPPNPKDKKKPPPKAKKTAQAEVPEVKEDPKDARLSDRALAFMVRWKLTRTECRNQGFILDGFPKTVRQARLLFEDVPIEIPDDPEEADPPLEKEEKPCADNMFPDFVIHCKALDTFLLERLLKTQFEHPHNTPEDFQRRLELYKNNFDVPNGVISYLESARSVGGKNMLIKTFDISTTANLVPPPPPASAYAPKQIDSTTQVIIDTIGKARNFGPTPEDIFQESERARLLAAELKAQEADAMKNRVEKEADDVASAEQIKVEEASKVRSMKDAERAMLEQRKGPLKAYLMANVTPVLTKGLIEVCNRRPADPVDFLAEWLFKHNPEDHPELYA